MAPTSGDMFGAGAVGRIGGIEAINVGEDHAGVGADHLGDPRGEAVIVAKANFFGSDRVVFVDHRDDTQLQQRLDGGTSIEITPAVFGVLGGEQNLRHLHVVAGQRVLPGMGQPHLPGRRRSLAFLEPQSAVARSAGET